MRVLVTGITGSLGKALLPILLEEGHEVVGYSRCEFKNSQMAKHPSLTLYMGDVRDRDRLLEASRGVDLVFHLAAIKRIEAADEQPEEAIATNITGTENVLFAQRMNKINRVVFVSTDKACLPITTYGFTKATGERLVLRNPNNVVVRYGNVLASRGSVLQAFVDGITKDGVIHVTDKQMTRFWWSLSDAAAFVYLSSRRPVGGLAIPNLKAYPVVALAKAIARVLNKPEPRIVEIGMRGIEKLHEDMRAACEGAELRSDNKDLWFTMREIDDVLKEIIVSH